MSYKLEGRDIVWSGFEDGMSDDPYKGIAELTGVNTISVPGEASVSFAQVNNQVQPFLATFTSATFTGNVITPTITTGSIMSYTAVVLTTSGTLPTGLSLSTTYWVFDNGGGTLKLYTDCFGNTQATFTNGTGSGTHTMTSIDMGEVRYFERTFGHALDVNGRVWAPVVTSPSGTPLIRYTYMNNTITNASGNGLVIFKGSGSTKYLFVFRNNAVDYTVVADTLGIFSSTGTTESGITPAWTNSWKTLNTASGTNNPHECTTYLNNVVFFTDASYVGSLRENPGSTFDPATSTTYEWNITALALPRSDIGQCIEAYNDRVLIGGLYNYVYNWNAISTGVQNAIQIAEKGVKRIITVNTNAFIFAGQRGRIFITNGSQADFFKKIPDHLLGIDPVFTFYGVAYAKNQIYFGVSATKNDGTASTAYGGLWAIDIDTKALRRPALMSTSTATVTAVFPAQPSTISSIGYSLLSAWKTSTPTYGIDASSSTPYTTYVAYVITDMTPVGLYLNRKTLENIEFKLSAPLVNGEGVRISYRKNLTDSFTQISETLFVSGADNLSDVYTVNFENCQWLQLKVEIKSTSTTPSYTRLKEIRAR